MWVAGIRFTLSAGLEADGGDFTMTAFQGAYTALITPMTSDHELNEGALRAVTEFNIQAGINGFWIACGPLCDVIE